MPSPPDVAELPLALPPEKTADPEFDTLPEPRRPGKRITVATLTVTAAVALLLAYSLRGEALYTLQRGGPAEAGNLTHFRPVAAQANTWIHGEGLLGTTGAIRYARPLDEDTFRLAPVAGNPNLWVEIRVPAGLEGRRFVPPTSFVGRLVPLSTAGLRHRNLPESVAQVGEAAVPEQAWLLIDGEAPESTRWACGLMALFLAFAAFSLWGIYRLLRSVRD